MRTESLCATLRLVFATLRRHRTENAHCHLLLLIYSFIIYVFIFFIFLTYLHSHLTYLLFLLLLFWEWFAESVPNDLMATRAISKLTHVILAQSPFNFVQLTHGDTFVPRLFPLLSTTWAAEVTLFLRRRPSLHKKPLLALVLHSYAAISWPFISVASHLTSIFT